jgi:hypothetical protein
LQEAHLADILKHMAGAVRMAFHAIVTVLAALWSFARAPVLFFLQVAAALILLFEEWGWQPLMALLGRLAKYRPIARLEAFIASLPPYPSLLVFALPTTLLFPLKLLSMWLLANGQVFTAGVLFLGAKVASTALVARIFMLTQPALMRIGWFARTYNWFIPWKNALFVQIRASWVWRYGRMVKTAVKRQAKQSWTKWKPILLLNWESLRPRLIETVRSLRVSMQTMWRRMTGA